MAHYDCSNCGESMGIDFGCCSACTPSEYHAITRQLSRANERAEEAWADHVREEMKAMNARKATFVDAFEWPERHALKTKLHELRMKHDHGYRRQHERDAKTRMNHPITGAEIHVEPGEQIPLFDNL